MNLRDWNEFLWRVVEERLYKPGSRLYLAFDESLLEEELTKKDLEIPTGGPTNALNASIQDHCQPMRNGFIGLSRQPGGRCWKDNWQWVFEADEADRTLALTFAVQQVLAAEHMQSVSFYTAYWRMLGASADETRINPFGDQGRNSFTRLWGQLRKELEAILGVEQWEITFDFGRGSNKYRNLPVSQSLLSEGDMRLAKAAIRGATNMNDDRLYAALRRTKLSSSGQRKVYMAALKDGIVAQFREYLESEETEGEAKAKRPVVRLKAKTDVSALLLYEDYELFGDSIFHCTTTDEGVHVAEILSSYLSDNRCLVFEDKDDRISATASQVIQAGGAQVFILGHRSEIDEMLTMAPDDTSIPRLSQYFAPVSTSLASDFTLARCISLPAVLENVDLSSQSHRRLKSAARSEVEMQLGGGLCVNKVSNAYILGFGPTLITRNGDTIKPESNCELDSEEMTVENALEELSNATVPCRFELRVADKVIYIDMVDGATNTAEAGYVLTDLCMLPVGLMDDRPLDDASRVISACDVNSREWPERRRKLIRSLEAAMAGRDVRWIKADNPSIEECLAAVSYLDLPRSLGDLIARKVRVTGLKPWPFYHRWKAMQKS